jgi:hypothetical protein
MLGRGKLARDELKSSHAPCTSGLWGRI